MGRPKAFNREKAINTVMNTIWKHGYEASSVKAIAEKLGITRSSFYNAFGSREELFVEAMGAYIGQQPFKELDIEPRKTSILKDLSDEIKDICKARTNDTEARGCFAVNSVTELLGTNEKLTPVLENTVKAGLARLENILEIAVKRGEMEIEDIHVKALALQSVIIGINVMSKVIRDEKELWTIAKYNLEALQLYRE